MKHSQVKWGAVLAYILIAGNALYGLLISPYILGRLGSDEYGVYKTIAALTNALMVLDLGMGGTVMRYIAKYQASQQAEKISNFVAMSLVQAAVLAAAVGLVGVLIWHGIPGAYAATFTQEQVEQAQLLFSILIVIMMLHMFSNVINGVITGSNRFMFGNGVRLARLAFRIVMVLVMLSVCRSAVVLVLIDLASTVLFLVMECLYVRYRLKIRIRLYFWDKAVFLESGKYTILMFLTSIAAQINGNVDNVLIGVMSGPTFVTVYSFGLLIFGMFEQLSTSVSSVMLPTVTRLIEREEGMSAVVDLVVQAGRIQFMLLGAALAGFACIGRDFIRLWLGTGFDDVYIITLILMTPALFELCVNVCLSILRAKNMLTFRTLTLFGSTILNVIVTVIAIRCWSYIGAALGTAASFIVGSLLIMNVYYVRRLGLPMLRIYARIFRGTWLCLLCAGSGLFLFSRFVHGTWPALILGVVVFVLLYGATLLLFGFTEKEKRHFRLRRS